MGAAPEEFPPAARKLVEAGFDVIDLNFACPVKKVLGRCRGGYLLGEPRTALEIVGRVRDAAAAGDSGDGEDAPRHGRQPGEPRAVLRDLRRRVRPGRGRGHRPRPHGRGSATRAAASWEFLREVKRHAGAKTVLGSGDLFTAQDCLDMMRETGVDGVAVARGAIGNPWIFEQARALVEGRPLPPPPSLHEQREVIAEHYRLAEEIYGWPRFGRHMRKFGIKYAQLHPRARRGPRRVRRRAPAGGTARGARKVVRRRPARPLSAARARGRRMVGSASG